MNCVEFEEFCRKWIDGSWKFQADETQSHCKQNPPLLRPSQIEGRPGLCAQRRKVGHPPRIESALNLLHSPALEEQCFAKCDSR
jgi:hypothetical protein